MRAIRNREQCAGSPGQTASKKGISESPQNLVLVIPTPHASVVTEKRFMMTRCKSKVGVGDTPGRILARGDSLPVAPRQSCRVERTLTHWKQRFAAHSTRHTFWRALSSFSRRWPEQTIAELRAGFAGIFASDYNEELGIVRADRRPPILKRLKTAHTYGR